MSSERTRERIVELLRDMRSRTVDRGCTPGEAAKFAAKCAEWIEKYQIDEVELRAGGDSADDEVEVCENTLRTGKRVFNPGTTRVVDGLARGMCCKVVLLHQRSEAVYGVVGDALDADYVCQIATMVVPALQTMARLEGVEHGYEKAGLIRWSNQYLTGAGSEIQRRLEAERKQRSEAKEAEHLAQLPSNGCTAVVLVTGLTVATAKREATEEGFKRLYPQTRTTYSRSQYDSTANERGREAGKRVGLHVGIEG